MIPTVYFTNGIPVCPGGFPCLSPVLRWRPLRAVHSSSKLLFACRHLKSITLTNLHSREHCYHWLHTEACWSSTSQVRSELGEFVYVCVYKESKREELQHQVQWLPRQHTTHTQWWTSTCEANTYLTQQLLPKSLRVWTAAEWVEESGEGELKNKEEVVQYITAPK